MCVQHVPPKCTFDHQPWLSFLGPARSNVRPPLPLKFCPLSSLAFPARAASVNIYLNLTLYGHTSGVVMIARRLLSGFSYSSRLCVWKESKWHPIRVGPAKPPAAQNSNLEGSLKYKNKLERQGHLTQNFHTKLLT